MKNLAFAVPLQNLAGFVNSHSDQHGEGGGQDGLVQRTHGDAFSAVNGQAVSACREAAS